MNSDNKRKINKLKLIKLVLVLLIFAVLIFVTISLITWLFTGSSWMSGLFTPPVPDITVDEFNFDIGRNRSFADLGHHIIAAGAMGIKILDTDGREVFRNSFRMTQPAIHNSAERCIVFDVGGTSVRVLDGSLVLSSFEANGVIVSASINQNGWFCVVTQEQGAFRGIVTVYDNYGTARLKASKGTGYVVSAQLSHDNKNLAILNLAESGSRISFYHNIDTDKDEPDNLINFTSGLIIDICYLSNGDLLAFTSNSVFLVDASGENKMLYTFNDRRLGGYAYDNNFIALHLYDYGVGQQGRLVTFKTDGTILGEAETDREVVSMSVVNRTVIVLKNDGVIFYDEKLETGLISKNSFNAAGANRVLAINDTVAIATSDNSAVVIRAGEEEQ